MQLSVAPESNSAVASVLPMLTPYVDVCVSLRCSDSISMGAEGALVAPVMLVFLVSFGLLVLFLVVVGCDFSDSRVSVAFVVCKFCVVHGRLFVSSWVSGRFLPSHSVSSIGVWSPSGSEDISHVSLGAGAVWTS